MNFNFKGMLRGLLGRSVAGPDTDPQLFYGAQLAKALAMPNPDPLLRQMGQAEKVYYSIAAEPHVLGDIRSIRGNFRSHEYRLLAGDEGDSKSLAAQELCERWMASTQPNAICDWLDVLWQMSSAFLTGYRPHEVVWHLDGGKYLPQEVVDRPGRRFKFNAYGEPLLVSTANMMGAPLEQPWQVAISRHMADATNPYGVAVLSSCFWPWTFKTGGWRYFVKYCERHGLPWPVARYPLGTGEAEQDALEAAVANMIEAGYVVAPEGTGLELLTKIRKDTNLRHLIVFVLTTSNDEKDKFEAFNMNVAGYMLKSDMGNSFIRAVELIDSYWRVVEFPEPSFRPQVEKESALV